MAERDPVQFPFDAVLFDLDGTLVATDRFWPDAARAGALRAFEELELKRDMPSRQDWMGMVGYPLEEGFAKVFGDLDVESRRVVMERCVEAEHQALRAGHAVLLPGAREALEFLRERGVRIGIASNCGRDYLDAMLNGLGLDRWIEAPRCLDSPGISDKAGMIEDLLWTFDTRSAVMVGDRISDRDAAWANGLPHVHLARGYSEAGEVARCEAVIDGLDELVPRLEGRTSWLRTLIEELDLLRIPSLAVTGGPASGKSLLARDLVRELSAHGRAARVWDGDADDRDRVIEALNGPSAAGELILVEGRRLLESGLADLAERTLVLEIPPELARRRLAGRDARNRGPEAYQRCVEEPLRAAAEARTGASSTVNGLRIASQNPLGPLPGPGGGSKSS